jgi:hypothetical protein
MTKDDVMALLALKYQLEKMLKESQQQSRKLELFSQTLESMLLSHGLEDQQGESRLKIQKRKGIV